MWLANAKRQRALKVVRRYKTKPEIKVITKAGAEFLIRPATYEAAGYKLVKAKPSYADHSDI